MKSRAAEVWSRLLDCFGESLTRKFPGKDPPAEWVVGLSMLKPQQLERAFRRMNYQGLTAPPTLPMFMRLARSTHDEDDPDAAPSPTPRLEGPAMEKWDVMAGQWLLAYIRTEMTKNPRKWGKPASYAFTRVPQDMWPAVNAVLLGMGKPRVEDTVNLNASPAFVRNVARLVEAKKAWAADMRDLGQNDPQGRVPMSLAKATWDDYIQFAEGQMETDPPAATSSPA